MNRPFRTGFLLVAGGIVGYAAVSVIVGVVASIVVVAAAKSIQKQLSEQ